MSRSCSRSGHAPSCICAAHNWQLRADRLYALLNARGEWPESVRVLPCGRMSTTGQTVSVVETAKEQGT